MRPVEETCNINGYGKTVERQGAGSFSQALNSPFATIKRMFSLHCSSLSFHKDFTWSLVPAGLIGLNVAAAHSRPDAGLPL